MQRLFFLLPLCTGLYSSYVCKRCQDEIGQLAGIVAAISLIISLVLAPWEIQLLLLLMVLLLTPKLLWKKDDTFEQNNDVKTQDMVGSQHESSTHGVAMKYRGITLHKN